MKKLSIRLTALAASALMLFSPTAESFDLLSKAASYENEASQSSYDNTIKTETHINPLYADTVSESDLVYSSQSETFYGDSTDSSNTFSYANDAVKYIRENMKNRTESITFILKTNATSNIVDPEILMDAALEHTGNPVEGDYLNFQYAGWRCITSYTYKNSLYYVKYKYTVTYYTSASQEIKVDKEVASLLNNFNLTGKSDYTKIKTVYDYICSNIAYDYDNLDDDDYKLKFTAYAALIDKTAVCQGYAVLLYRFMLELGVDCRVICGDNHAWNIVEINGKYYNLDSTWDAGCSSYSYFLKCNANFTGHNRLAEYRTSSFNTSYPMSSTDFKSSNVCQDGSHSFNSGVITKEATCTTVGVRTFTCNICGDSYKELIPATGHKYKVTTVNPTYLAQGYTLHKCSVCSQSYQDNYTDKLVLDTVSGFKVSSTTANSVKLTWNQVSNANGYIVYKYDNSKKTWIRVTKTSTTVSSYTVTGLSAGTAYKFAAKAYRTVNGTEVTSGSFPQLSATTNPATISGFKVLSTSASAVKLTWNKLSNADGYIVYKYDNSKKTWVRVTKTTTNSNVYTVAGLSAGTTYRFAVKAYKTVNSKELTSPSFPQITTSTNPAAVNFTLTAGSKKATVKWNKVNGATGYIVYYKTSANGSWQRLKVVNGTSYTKTGLTKGKTYYFTVKAYRTVNGTTYNGTYTTKSVKIK